MKLIQTPLHSRIAICLPIIQFCNYKQILYEVKDNELVSRANVHPLSSYSNKTKCLKMLPSYKMTGLAINRI